MSLFDGLVALYHMNSGWTDASGSGNDLTAAGATINNVDQLLGLGCGDFDGFDDYAQKMPPSFGSDNAGAISGWIKATALASDAMAAYAESTSGTGDEVSFIFIGANGRTRLFFRVGGVITSLLGEDVNIVDDEWHNVIFQSDGSEVEIWVDGVQHTITEHIGTNTGQWFADATNADNFTLGAIGRLVVAGHVDALEDEIAIWNRPLTPSEIVNKIYNGGKGREIIHRLLRSGLGRGSMKGLGRGL